MFNYFLSCSGKSLTLFQKNAEPIFHLAGIDITVIRVRIGSWTFVVMNRYLLTNCLTILEITSLSYDLLWKTARLQLVTTSNRNSFMALRWPMMVGNLGRLSTLIVFNKNFKVQWESCDIKNSKNATIMLLRCLFTYYNWLAQLVRSLPSDHKVPGSIPGFAKIWIFVRPSFLPKLTQLSIFPG